MIHLIKVNGNVKFICFLVLILFTNSDFLAQTNDEPSRKEEGLKLYKSELESKTIGTVVLLNNKLEITDSKLDINSVWVVNPDYPNISFGVVTVEDGTTIIDLSNAPKGKYYVQGKKNNVIVAYRTSKI